MRASSWAVHLDCFFAGDVGALASALFIEGLDGVGGKDMSFSGMLARKRLIKSQVVYFKLR